MSKVIKLRKGLDIKLEGEAEKVLMPFVHSKTYGVCPSYFKGVTPKLLVKVGDRVKAGSSIMFDKHRPNILFASPVSGTIKEIVRGEKRKILDVVIEADETIEYEKFDIPTIEAISIEQIKEFIVAAGLWPIFIQRPYGIVASPEDTPRAIYTSLFDSSPLGIDMDVPIGFFKNSFAAGLKVLKKLSNNNLFLGVSTTTSSDIVNLVSKYGTVNTFSTKHPAGCVGVQIANTAPIGKGEVIWTIDPQSIYILGKLFSDGKVDMLKIVAVTGSEVIAPKYHKMVVGAQISSFLKTSNIKEQVQGDSVRVIDGNILTGATSSLDNHFGFYNSMLTVIPEGDKYDFIGWIAPRFKKFSVSKTYFSWLTPNKHYRLDTNQNGGQRAFVMNGEYDRVFPMDIYPVYLLKAILANDIDKMENLGIYEVIEEDMALCEFVCTSKIDVQAIVRQGIDSMIKELN